MTGKIIPAYEGPAVVISIVSLAMAPLTAFMFRQYFRGLQFLQMAYYFAMTMWNIAFSSQLYTAVIDFNKNLYPFCDAGKLVCAIKFPLSFGTVVSGFVLLLLFIFFIQKCCCKKDLQFQPVYLLFKGFFKWCYLPIVYHSTIFLARALDGDTGYNSTSDLAKAGGFLGLCVIYPILQLVGYKCIQKQNDPIWRKWTEFLGYIRLLYVGVMLGLGTKYNSDLYLHLAMVMLIIYPLMHAWKGEFKYPCVQRVLFIIGEGLFLALYFLFKYGPQYVTDYDIDFFILVVILVMDILVYLVRALRMCCFGFHEGKAEVYPEETNQEDKLIRSSLPPVKSSPRLKKNKYEHDDDLNLQNSRENLAGRVPPRRRR